MSDAGGARRFRRLLGGLTALALVLAGILVFAARRATEVPVDWIPRLEAANACTSPGRTVEVTPLTIDAALAAAQPGDTLLLADGQYGCESGLTTPTPAIALNSSGSAAAPLVRQASPHLNIVVSGAPGRPVTIKAKGSGAVFSESISAGARSWLVIDGLKIVSNSTWTGIGIDSCDHVTIRNCALGVGQTGVGMRVNNCNGVIIERNEVHDAKTHGIALFGRTSECIIRDNYVHDNDGCGIYLDCYTNVGWRLARILVEGNRVTRNCPKGPAAIKCSNVVQSIFRNNLVYKNGAEGFIFFNSDAGDASNVVPAAGKASFIEQVTRTARKIAFGPWSDDSYGNVIVCNTVYFDPGQGRLALNIQNKSRRFYIHDNIFWGGLGGAVNISVESLAGLDIDHNVICAHKGQTLLGERYPNDKDPGVVYTADEWRAKGCDKHSRVGVDPLFVSVQSDDYRLREGSPAIGAGCREDRYCPRDVTGARRAAGKGYDCGAYEFVPPAVK